MLQTVHTGNETGNSEFGVHSGQGGMKKCLHLIISPPLFKDFYGNAKYFKPDYKDHKLT